MKPIQDITNKMLHGPHERKEDYLLLYYDRVEDTLKELPAITIKRLEGTFLILDRAGEEVEIPLHRIRQVVKQGGVIWHR